MTEYAQATISPDIETGFYDTFEEKSDHDLDEATAKRNMRWQEMSQVCVAQKLIMCVMLCNSNFYQIKCIGHYY